MKGKFVWWKIFGLIGSLLAVLAGNAQGNLCHRAFSCTKASESNVVINPAGSGAFSQLYNTNGFTWEAWFRLKSPILPNSLIISVEDAVYAQDIFLGFGWGTIPTALCFYVSDNGVTNTVDWTESAQPLSLNTWYHVAAVCDYTNDILRLYLNGNLIASKTLAANIVANRMYQEHPAFIGNASASASGSDIDIDEAKFWNTVRSQTEIQNSMAECLSLPQSGLVAWFKADENLGTTAKSAVDANFTATLQNASWTGGAPVGDCFVVTINDNPSSCKDLNFSGSITSGYSVYDWSWDFGDGKFGDGQNVTHTYSGTGNETVDLTLKDLSGCSVSIVKLIDVSNVKPDLGPDQAFAICQGTTADLNGLYNTSTGYQSAVWNATDPATVGAGTYTLIAISTGGCADTAQVVIKQNPTVNVSFDTAFCVGGSYAGYTISGDYTDLFKSMTGCDSIRQLHLTVYPQYNTLVDASLCGVSDVLGYTQPGIYTDVFKSVGGCDSVRVLRISACAIYFPSAFSPNGDGKNDIFKALNTGGVQDFHLVVYNRWGQLVFESRDPNMGWDGSVNGKKGDAGDYIWYCEYFKNGDAAPGKLKGSILLVR